MQKRVAVQCEIHTGFQVLVALDAARSEQADDDTATSLEVSLQDCLPRSQLVSFAGRHCIQTVAKLQFQQVDSAAPYVKQQVDLCVTCAVFESRTGHSVIALGDA